MPQFAIFRVLPIKKMIDATNATRHGGRCDRGTHYDAERTSLNRHWFRGTEVAAPVEWPQAIMATIEALGARTRAGAPIAAELLLTASPPFFIEPTTGEWNGEKLERWVEANFGALEKRFPGQVAAARLDLDEASPHLAVCLVPIYRKSTKHRKDVPTVSYRRVFGGETIAEASLTMIGWQDWYAEAMAPLGLSRGVPKLITHREHLTHQQYARRMHEKETELTQAIEDNRRRDQKLREIRERLHAEVRAYQCDLQDFKTNKAAFIKETAARRADLRVQMQWIGEAIAELGAIATSQERRRLTTMKHAALQEMATLSGAAEMASPDNAPDKISAPSSPAAS
ncbi:MAG: plasmid recombination protein [Alphaproteobacteria bacterium]|nr:plasmid recombination protein [Alphaproteobacteria bacterium]